MMVLLFFTILLSSLSYSVFSKMKNIKIERRTLQVKTHNNKKILEQLDLNILEDRLLYAYQELTTKAANNVLNKDIQKQLIKDINKFKEKSNKNNPYSFLRLWSDYVHKCYQSKHQIYN
jgi:hypothetical protein